VILHPSCWAEYLHHVGGFDSRILLSRQTKRIEEQRGEEEKKRKKQST
jgi:hypothetical protein